MIERASMDGTGRTVLIDTELVSPNGITIDYEAGKIYWTDSSLDKIEYSNLDGSERTQFGINFLIDIHPFAVTLDNNVLFWSDWINDTIFSTHKTEGMSAFLHLPDDSFFINPNGIEAVTANRQAGGANPCDGNLCEQMCLLSATSVNGFSCFCEEGYDLVNETSCACELQVVVYLV